MLVHGPHRNAVLLTWLSKPNATTEGPVSARCCAVRATRAHHRAAWPFWKAYSGDSALNAGCPWTDMMRPKMLLYRPLRRCGSSSQALIWWRAFRLNTAHCRRNMGS